MPLFPFFFLVKCDGLHTEKCVYAFECVVGGDCSFFGMVKLAVVVGGGVDGWMHFFSLACSSFLHACVLGLLISSFRKRS